jgi:hypothetical protein
LFLKGAEEGIMPKSPKQGMKDRSIAFYLIQAEVTTEIRKAETAAGKPQADMRTTEPAAPRSPDESGSIRTRLSEMLHGLIGSFTAMAFNGAQMLVVLVTVFSG